MNTEIALLQVHLSLYSPGDKIYKPEAKGRHWLHPWQYQAEPIAGDEQRIWSGNLFKFFGTALALDVQAFGEGHDSAYPCGLAAELSDAGFNDVFTDEQRQQIIDMGQGNLIQFDNFGKHAHYIVAVRCKWWKEEDTWQGPGDYDSSFEILGRVDLNTLKVNKVAWNLIEVLESLLSLCKNPAASFANDVKDPSGTYDQGEVYAGQIIDRAESVLAEYKSAKINKGGGHARL